MNGYWTYNTRHGRYAIARLRDGKWHALLGEESLGAYDNPQPALDDLAGGHTFTPTTGIDPSTSGLPDDLADWELIRVR